MSRLSRFSSKRSHATLEALENRTLLSTVYLEVGSGKTYSTVQAAINAVPNNSSNDYVIQIAAGTYNEADVIQENQKNITLQGLGSNRSTIIQSNGNGSPAVWDKAPNFTVTNLTLSDQDTSAQHDEALYLDTNATHDEINNCTLKGYQDTFFSSSGVVFDCNSSTIYGSVDFIWGYATGYFKSDTLYMEKSGGDIVAPATSSSVTYGYVFSNCTIAAAPGVSLGSGSVYLGRPWGVDGQAAFLNCTIDGGIINSAGWLAWPGQNPDTSRFDQYELSGVSTSGFVSWSHTLSSSQAASFSQSNVLGGWTPPI
jgi:pectin methylesterase-like acyl-CoA thioesterase